MKLTNYVLIIFLILTKYSFAQEYKISIKVKNLQDTTIYLGHHFGNSFFVDDSVKLNNNGTAIFEGKNKLPGGMYFILLGKGKYFDIILDKSQKFSITCDTSNFLNTVKFVKSFQNYKFYSYQKYLNKQNRIISALKQKQKQYITSLDTLMMLEKQITITKNKTYLQKEELVNQHPDSLLSAIIKTTRTK